MIKVIMFLLMYFVFFTTSAEYGTGSSNSNVFNTGSIYIDGNIVTQEKEIFSQSFLLDFYISELVIISIMMIFKYFTIFDSLGTKDKFYFFK